MQKFALFFLVWCSLRFLGLQSSRCFMSLEDAIGRTFRQFFPLGSNSKIRKRPQRRERARPKLWSQIASLAESEEPQHRALRLFVRYVEYSTRRYKHTLPGSYFQNLKRLRYAVMVLVR
jgi:hypothetical protein